MKIKTDKKDCNSKLTEYNIMLVQRLSTLSYRLELRKKKQSQQK